MADVRGVHITRLIAIPTVITLAVTILRLVGELKHWPTPWFSTQAGGGGAVVGISWLPIIFGPYFALKLAGAGEGAASIGKAIGFAVGSLLVFVAGAFLFGSTLNHPNALTVLGLVLMLGSAFVPGLGWRSLGNTLVAYAFAARIPVLIVMYLAMTANGGAGWGTHYDGVPPALASMPPLRKFFFLGVLPQMMLWIGFTAVVGSIVGTVVTAIACRKKQAAPTAG
ncbi:MAG: hypothetical protein ABSF45_04460 [Terriglobia bacterium]|jgi:hypothetical protein